MYNILLVESDEAVLGTISRLIEEKIKDAKVVECARNGNEAILGVINNQVDIILIPIRLAGMNGLEAIKHIRNISKTVHIIIISEYDYFEFAKEAMRMNVSDFLLKPINPIDLVESIRREIKKLTKEHEKQQQIIEEEHLISDTVRFIEYSFIYSILYNGNYINDSMIYEQLLGIGNSGYVMNMKVVQPVINNQLNTDRVINKIHGRLKEIINEQSKCAIGPLVMNHVVIYIRNEAGKDTKEEIADIVKLAKKIVKVVKDTLEVELVIGIGSTKPLERLHESYEEALHCLSYKENGQIIHIKDIKDIKYRNTRVHDCVGMANQLVESIKYGKHDTHMVLSYILETLRCNTKEERINTLIEVLLLVSYECGKEGQLQTKFIDYVAEYKEVIGLTVEEQEQWAQRRFQYILKSIKQNKTDRKGTIINAAMQYVEGHYSKDITLNEIAEYVNLSPQHFSKIFKEETNTNYVEWVTNIRITKAKDLMNNTDKTIKEICYMVGYQDPNYFSRIFKKYVGVSPTIYIKYKEEQGAV